MAVSKHVSYHQSFIRVDTSQQAATIVVESAVSFSYEK